MAYKLIARDYNRVANIVTSSFVLDSADDAATLPESAPGSKAIVAEKDGPIYMVNASGKWKEL